MTRLSRRLAIGGALALALTACGGGGSTDDAAPLTAADLSNVEHEGTISVLTRYAGENADFFEEMAKEYEAAYPDVTVEVQQESDQGYKDKIKAQVASQSVPDIYFSWAGNYAEQFYDNGLALDLSEVIAPDTEWGSTMIPSATSAFSKEEKYYGVPLALDAKYVLYNEKIFEESGVTVPNSLEELLSVCGTLKSKDVTPMSFGNKDGWPAIHYITQLNSYNVAPETLAKDYDPATSSFTDPGYVKALEQFSEIMDECTVTGNAANGVDYYSERDAFGQGEAAMFYVENVEFSATAPEGSQADQDGYGFFRLPAPADAAGDTETLTGAPDGFLINPRAENPALAVDFMKFVTSKENAETLTSIIGFPSPVIDTLNESNSTPQMRESIEDLKEASELSIWLDTAATPAVAGAYLAGVQGLITGEVTAEEVMDSVKSASDEEK